MLRYLLQRLLYTLPIAIGVSLVCFALVHLAPGDPLSAVLPERAPPELVAQVREEYGFDKPVPVQYLIWLRNIVTGDFGTSITTRRPVLAEIIPAIKNSLMLAAVAIFLAFLAGTTLGTIAGYSDPQADKLAAQAKVTFDPAQQDAVLAQLHSYIVDQAMWIWVVHDLNPRAMSPRVKGFVQAQSWFQDLTPVYVE